MNKDYAEMPPSGVVRRIGGRQHFEIDHRESTWPIVVTESLWKRASYRRGIDLAMKLMREFPHKRGRSLCLWTQVEELGAFHADLTEDDTGDGVTVMSAGKRGCGSRPNYRAGNKRVTTKRSE